MSSTIATQLQVHDGSAYIPMPDWARFYFDLGYQIGRMHFANDMYLRLVIVAPITDYIATFLSLGNLIANASKPVDLDAHIRQLQSLPIGTKMARIYLNKWQKQRVEKVDCNDINNVSIRCKESTGVYSNFPMDQHALNVMPVYVDDTGVRSSRYAIDSSQNIVCNQLFASHYSRIINPSQPYAAIVGSMAQQKEELELTCWISNLEFALKELLIADRSVLFQPNLLLASSQMRSELDDINANLVIFTDANGVLNHSHEVHNRHHVYILDYHDNNLDSAIGHIQNQFVYRCDETVQLQNNYQFKSAEVSAYFVKGY